MTRTLSEAVGREIATVYQQINQAYLSGFIDTATGQALDLVVSILDLTRMTADFAGGLVTFFRDTTVPDGNITMAAATLLSTEKGEATFVTTELRTLQRGQARIDVPVRATVSTDVGLVAAGAITTQVQPLVGIARVTNFDATVRAAAGETDEQLRVRAKTVLRASGNATLAALRRVVLEEDATIDEITDPNSANGKASAPGTVTLLVKIETSRFPSLQAAVNETRAAGVLTNVVARFVFIKPQVTANIPRGMPAEGQDKVKDNILAAMQAYIDGLASGAPAEGSKLVELVKKPTDAMIAKALTGVADIKIVNLTASKADTGSAQEDPLVEALFAAVQGVSATDSEALRTVIKEVIDSEAPALLPSGGRIPAQDLILGLGDDNKPTGPASDGQIASGKFLVKPPEGFSVVLDMQRTDILLTES